jgi:fumarate reductase flavoprotein subunit
VFGGLAGEAAAAWLAAHPDRAAPDRSSVERAMAAALRPFAEPRGDLNTLREELYDLMWNDVGILRNAAGLRRALAGLESLHERLRRTGVAEATREFNLTWHDWLSLDSLLAVSRAIATAAAARADSRGAHYREDFPKTSDLAASAFTRLRLDGPDPVVEFVPVEFTRVRPGETLLVQAKVAA